MTSQNERFYDIEIVVEGYPAFYITKELYFTVNKKERAAVQESVKDKVVEDLPNMKSLVKYFILMEGTDEELNIVKEKIERLKINVSNADMSLFTEKLDIFGGRTVCIIPLPLDQKIKEIQVEIDEKLERVEEIESEIYDLECEREEVEYSMTKLREKIEMLREKE